MDERLGEGGFGVELHGVGLDAHDGASVGGEEHMGNLGEHRIGQVLDHEGHSVGFGPAEAKQSACLGLAGFQGDACPAERTAEFDEIPVVGAFIHEEGFAGGDAVDVDGVGEEVVRKRLLDVEEHSIEAGVFTEEAVEDVVDVGRVVDRAIEVGGEPMGAFFVGDLADFDETRVVQGGVVAAKLHFQAGEAVAEEPVAKEDWVAVSGFRACQFGDVDRVFAADKMPGGEFLKVGVNEEVGGIEAREAEAAPLGGGEVGREVGVHVDFIIGFVHRDIVEDSVGVVKGDVESRGADEGGEPGDGFEALEGAIVVETGVEVRQDSRCEGMADLNGMTGGVKACPGFGEVHAE